MSKMPLTRTEADETIVRLQGEAIVMLDLLCEALGVLDTIEPESANESEYLDQIKDEIRAVLVAKAGALLQQALDALTYQGTMGPTRRQRRTAAIQALRTELAKPEPEPVAWREFDGEGGYLYYDFDGNENRQAEWDERYKDSPQYLKGWLEPLYLNEQL